VSKVFDVNFIPRGVKSRSAAQIASASMRHWVSRVQAESYQHLIQGRIGRQTGLAHLFIFNWNVMLCKERFKALGFSFGACAGMRYCPVLIYILVR